MLIEIRKVRHLNTHELNDIRDESVREGFRFIGRLIDDYATGANRFDREGEAMFLCYADGIVVGVCGLNREETQGDRRIGRLRRFYVLPDFRRSGIGRRLVSAVLADARESFDAVQLRTDTEAADLFYLKIGFDAVKDERDVTHRLELQASAPETGSKLEILFIRHGHGEHLLDYPNRLNTLHPDLTEYGTHQILQLRNRLTFRTDDIILVSPTKRTIRSAELLLEHADFYITPFVGPRMFPQHPDFPFLLCDRTYSRDEIVDMGRAASILDFGMESWGDGINRLEQEQFEVYGRRLLQWCRTRGKRAVVISHDRTITSYRELLGERGLTRAHFLGEAGVYIARYAGEPDHC